MEAHSSPLHILVVDDNDTMRSGMVRILRKAGNIVEEASDGQCGLSTAQDERFDLVITDYRMKGMDGLELLKKIKATDPQVEIIVITAFGTIELAVEAMKAGARDFISKPFSKDELKIKVDRVAERIRERKTVDRLTEENRYLREEVELKFNFGEIVGESPGMKKIYRTIEKIGMSDTSILIYGESGTGKELVARAIHSQSGRRDKAFIRVNCGALAEGVLESELFGHERGAFTNALRQKKGRFELADGGTLFLDEIGDIPLSTQVKLLRVLQEKEFERVGGEETIRVDVRVIAATHRDLPAEVREGRFRDDLYYRLHILPLHLPPLRERKDDIPNLTTHFIQKIGKEVRKTELILTDEALSILTAYDWPGNVRELENVLERAIVLCETDRINEQSLGFLSGEKDGMKIAETSLNLERSLAALERRLLEQALKAAGGVKARAARILGIKESALYYKLDKYDLH